ncbi:MAG TPA: TIGR04190 family B12-binding domain/radical SAM domain protein [Vicinamibacterales bacterium]|nr:TIGR04190 family B12-binding domain/radical SAM domain protein [Vicinamibacterales bacterium]
MRNPFARDLVLLHAPALYDFRTRRTFLGPVADAVPSTPMFEMYPVGLTSIAAFLERNHYNVEIVNLAYRMLRDPAFDVPAAIGRLKAPVFGIDLHWLPHVQGALAVAELVKRQHPESRVLMGGLSATYYHDELVRYPWVDFVIRGDSTEEPVRQLLQALREHRPLEAVENLTWKRADGSVVANPLTFVPADLDYVDVPAYQYLIRSMFKYRSLRNLLPCLEWLQYPITLLLSARGCTQECAICGGSHSAYRTLCGRDRPALRSPEKLAADVRAITSFSRAPIFMVHDPRMGGRDRARRLFGLLADIRPANEMIFELYYPAGPELFGDIARSVPTWSLELTLESPDERIRRRNGKFPWPNRLVEDTIDSALAHGCRTVDVFFMVGLADERREDVLAIADYCEHLLKRFGEAGRLRPFVAPLGPFLDPGSRAFEQPGLGYRRACHTLEDHRQAFLHDGWQQILSYETQSMTRDEIVRATYDVAERLNGLKRQYGLIDEATFAGVTRRLAAAREALQATEQAGELSRRAAELANHGTMFGDDELKWPVRQRFHVGWPLVRSLGIGLAQEIAHTAARVVGRYDVAPVGVRTGG